MEEFQLHYIKLKEARFKRLHKVCPIIGYSGIHRTLGEMVARAGIGEGFNYKRVPGDLGETVLYLDCCSNRVCQSSLDYTLKG